MIENAPTIPTVDSIIRSSVHRIQPGFPRSVVDALKPRSDRFAKSPQESYAMLLAEGAEMGPIDTIEIGEGRKIHLALTAAGSPHTPLYVPYEDFDEVYRRHNAEAGIPLPDAPLITYQNDNGETVVPKSVPQHLIIWCILEKDGLLGSVDLTDIAASLTPGPDGSIDMNAVNNKFKLQIPYEKQVELFEKLVKKATISRDVLLELYNTKFREKFARETKGEKLYHFNPKTAKDVMQGFTYGFYRGDKSKMLGQMNDDGLGGGPMSNATAHYHVCLHMDMEEINEINLNSKAAGFDHIMKYIQETPGHEDYFKRSMDLMMTKPDYYSTDPEDWYLGGVLRKLIKNVDIYDILKLIDPYATIAHSLLSDWLEEKTHKHFAKLTTQINKFQHHAGNRQLRAVEGIEITVNPNDHEGILPETIKAQMYSAAVELLGKEVAPLWDNIRDFISEKILLSPQQIQERLQTIQERYGLPHHIVSFIAHIEPTEKQLKNLLYRNNLSIQERGKVNSELIKYSRERKIQLSRFNKAYSVLIEGSGTEDDLADLITSLQKLQLFDTPWNKGYNITGVPGFAISHNRTEDGNYHMMIGWLLSLKGLTEAWGGGGLARPV